MTTKITFIALAAAAATLSACGGGGTSVNTAPTYLDLVTRAEAASAGIIDLQSGTITGTERTDLPDSGTATYSGYVGGDVQGGRLIGELSLTASLASGDSGTVTGSATNFQHENNGAYTGTLQMTNGAIHPGGTTSDPDTFTGDLTGDLVNGGTTYDTNLGLDGSFFGGDDGDPTVPTDPTLPTAVAGIVDGALTETGVGTDFLTGAFVATQ
ncbi:MAG: hypothetical protein IE919_18820 [Thioclava sp.]|nr:hypothetical protein [Thioclava sp.]MBD3805268.1 hypothetical protein [Thioclava sp.]